MKTDKKQQKYTYVFEDDILYRCSDKFKKSTKKMIELFKSEYVYELDLEKEGRRYCQKKDRP